MQLVNWLSTSAISRSERQSLRKGNLVNDLSGSPLQLTGVHRLADKS